MPGTLSPNIETALNTILEACRGRLLSIHDQEKYTIEMEGRESKRMAKEVKEEKMGKKKK